METTLLSEILFIVMVTLTFELMTPKQIGFFPFHRGIMWPSLVKIQYTELKLSCGNDCVVKNYIYSVTLTFDLMTPKYIGFFPFHRGIMWPSLVKIQFTELTLSCGNDPVVRNSIHSNGDLELWPSDPKINRFFPLPEGNHVAKFGQDPIYRTKVMWKRPCCQKFYL